MAPHSLVRDGEGEREIEVMGKIEGEHKGEVMKWEAEMGKEEKESW